MKTFSSWYFKSPPLSVSPPYFSTCTISERLRNYYIIVLPPHLILTALAAHANPPLFKISTPETIKMRRILLALIFGRKPLCNVMLCFCHSAMCMFSLINACLLTQIDF